MNGVSMAQGNSAGAIDDRWKALGIELPGPPSSAGNGVAGAFVARTFCTPRDRSLTIGGILAVRPIEPRKCPDARNFGPLAGILRVGLLD